MTTSKNETNSVITKKDLRKVFWKSLPFEISWNYVRQDHMGFAYSMTPIIEKLYKTKEDRVEALQRTCALPISYGILQYHSIFLNARTWNCNSDGRAQSKRSGI